MSDPVLALACPTCSARAGEDCRGFGYCPARTAEPVNHRTCEADGHHEDRYGAEHYWPCGAPGVIDVDGTLMCEDHAGERGYGPSRRSTDSTRATA